MISISTWTVIQALLVLFVIFLLYKFVFVALKNVNFYKKQGLPTQFIPLIGSLIMNYQNSLKKHNDAIYDLKQFAAKEPNCTAIVRNFASTPVLILLDPKLKKELAFNHDCYELGDFFGPFGKIFSTGLSAVKGAEWKKQRKIIGQSFHFEFLRENIPLLVNTTQEQLQALTEKDLGEVRVLEEVEKLTGELIGRTFFGGELKNYNIKGKPVTLHLMDTLTDLGKSMMTPEYLILGAKFIAKGFLKKHRDLIENINLIEDTCQKIINDRRNKPDSSNVKDLAYYLLGSQQNPAEEDRLTDDAIIGNYVIFIIAGTGTTSLLISMTLYQLAQHPEMLEKLREEIRDIYDKESVPSMDALNKMNYLSALFKETLRLYNPVGIGAGFRTSTKDHKLGNIEVKKGTMVGASFVHNDFDPQYFEDPQGYNPQRWIDSPNMSDPYVFTPFWAGPRNCIGQHLALLESKIIVCEFVKKFDFEMKKDFKLKLGTKRAYGPMEDLPMHLIPRK